MKILFFIWLLSPMGLWSIARKQHHPCDESNRLNKVILLWFAFTRYEDIISFPKFKHCSRWDVVEFATFKEEKFADDMLWLKNDLWEQLSA